MGFVQCFIYMCLREKVHRSRQICLFTPNIFLISKRHLCLVNQEGLLNKVNFFLIKPILVNLNNIYLEYNQNIQYIKHSKYRQDSETSNYCFYKSVSCVSDQKVSLIFPFAKLTIMVNRNAVHISYPAYISRLVQIKIFILANKLCRNVYKIKQKYPMSPTHIKSFHYHDQLIKLSSVSTINYFLFKINDIFYITFKPQ